MFKRFNPLNGGFVSLFAGFISLFGREGIWSGLWRNINHLEAHSRSLEGGVCRLFRSIFPSTREAPGRPSVISSPRLPTSQEGDCPTVLDALASVAV
jgi:hypothetical protein